MDTKPNAVSVSVARGPAADSQYATPRRPTKQETREKILAAALGLFARTGLDRTSVNAIARRADVAHGTVFWHFPSKKQLYAEVARRAGDTFLEHMRVYAASGSMPLRQVIAEWFDSLRHDADIPTLLLSLSGPRRHPDTDDMTEAFERALRGVLDGMPFRIGESSCAVSHSRQDPTRACPCGYPRGVVDDDVRRHRRRRIRIPGGLGGDDRLLCVRVRRQSG